MIQMELYSSRFRNPCGSVREGETIHFELAASEKKYLTLICRSDDGTYAAENRMEKVDGVHRCDVAFQNKGLYFYSIG